MNNELRNERNDVMDGVTTNETTKVDPINRLMEQAQVFASAWSLVGGRFDNGGALEESEAAKAELRSMLMAEFSAEPFQQTRASDLSTISKDVQDALLFALWHHQGGSSPVGQPIRAMLGIGQHDHMTDEEVAAAKRVQSALISSARPAHLVPTALRFDQPIPAEPIDGDQPLDLSNVIGHDGRVVLIDDKAQPVACPLDLEDSSCVCGIRICDKCRAEDAAPQPSADQGAELSDERVYHYLSGVVAKYLREHCDGFAVVTAGRALIAADRAARGGAK